MKKFALLGAVAAFATAGGVFAAWTFTDSGNIEAADVAITYTPDNIINYVGTGTLASSGSLVFTVEGSNDRDHNTFTLTVSGSVSLSYTPADGEVEDTGVVVSVKIAAVSIDVDGAVVTIPEYKVQNIQLDEEHKTWSMDVDDYDSTIVTDGEITTDIQLESFETALSTELPKVVEFTAVEAGI